MRVLFQDLGFCLRQLRKSPGYALTVVLTLGIGIGTNTAIFSAMDAVVLRPLAVPDLSRIMTVHEHRDQGDEVGVALGNFDELQHQSRAFERMAVLSPVSMSLTGSGDASSVQAELVSPTFFEVLRSSALKGRVFNQSDSQPGRNDVVELSYAFWQRYFGSDPSVLGRKIELEQKTYEVIGVMPGTVRYPSAADVYIPFAPSTTELADRNNHNLLVLGRLRAASTITQARAEMKVISRHMAQEYPATNQSWSVSIEPLLDNINGAQTPLYLNLIQCATLFVLLVVCANVANLQFARGVIRHPEIAMRTALGATRRRIMRQLLTENILLGLIGASVGLLLAKVYITLCLVAMPERVSRYMAGWSNISLNGRALTLSLLMALGAGVVSGFAPALGSIRLNLIAQLKAGSRSIVGGGRSERWRNTFAVAQIALAVALVIGAALMSKGMVAMMHSADRYDPSHKLIFTVHLPQAQYSTPVVRSIWYKHSLDRLREIPGVKQAELSNALPLSDQGWQDGFEIENRPREPGRFQTAFRIPVSPGYFTAFHIPIIAGRGFAQSDDLGSKFVAIVSRRFAAQNFPDADPIGHRIRLGVGSKDLTPWITIIGVTEDADYNLFLRVNAGTVYLNVAQLPPLDETYSLVTDGNASAVAPMARKALAQIDAVLPLDDVEDYAQFMHEKLIGLDYVAALLGTDAIIALLLAAIGIFGVMANLVAERTREIGVRLALGARRKDVLLIILRRASILMMCGLGFGLVGAFALARGVASLLYGVSPNDALVFGVTTASIAAIALLSSWIPARRAAAIDPIIALRDE